MSQVSVPQPVFPHRAYGVEIAPMGEGGEDGWAAPGHVTSRRFTAAANHYARTVDGIPNAADGDGTTAEEFARSIKHVWAVPVDPDGALDGEAAWSVVWDGVREDDEGAIPMTVWEP